MIPSSSLKRLGGSTRPSPRRSRTSLTRSAREATPSIRLNKLAWAWASGRPVQGRGEENKVLRRRSRWSLSLMIPSSSLNKRSQLELTQAQQEIACRIAEKEDKFMLFKKNFGKALEGMQLALESKSPRARPRLCIWRRSWMETLLILEQIVYLPG